MKQEIVNTTQRKLILQVYHNHFVYGKDKKSHAHRKKWTDWKSEILSKSGHWENGRVVLAKSNYSPDLTHSDLVILNDFNSDAERETVNNQHQKWTKESIDFEKKTQVQYFSLIGHPKKFEIFKLKLVENHIELYLQYDSYEIGEPKRENFKVCEIRMESPVEVKINGKLDHSLTSGRERSFKERCYIFHLIGETNEFELAREPFGGSIKLIPKPLKTIDLMKELY